MGGRVDQGQMEAALLWLMSFADGRHSLLDIASRAGLPFEAVHEAALALERAELAGQKGRPTVKVVLFCGGLGTRLRDLSGEIPKPMVKIGYRPILWHVMRYYAHFGHKDFILCLGYKADVIKEFFLTYEEWISNDFTLSDGGKRIELKNNDIADWNITFVDTGLHANIGQRLMAVRKYVEDEEMFLANYSDGLTDLNLLRHDQHLRGQRQDRLLPGRSPGPELPPGGPGRQRGRHRHPAGLRVEPDDQRRLLRVPPRSCSTTSTPATSS